MVIPLGEELAIEVRIGLLQILRSEHRKGYDPIFTSPIANWDVFLVDVWMRYFRKPFLKYDSSHCLEKCNAVFMKGSTLEVRTLLEYMIEYPAETQPSFLFAVSQLLYNHSV